MGGGRRKPATPSLRHTTGSPQPPHQPPDPPRFRGPGLSMSSHGASFQLPGFSGEETEAQRGDGPSEGHTAFRGQSRTGTQDPGLPTGSSLQPEVAQPQHRPENHGVGLPLISPGCPPPALSSQTQRVRPLREGAQSPSDALSPPSFPRPCCWWRPWQAWAWA